MWLTEPSDPGTLPRMSRHGMGLLLTLLGCSEARVDGGAASQASQGASSTAALGSSSSGSTPSPSAPSSAPGPSASAVRSAAQAELPRSARPTPLEWCRAPVATLAAEGYYGGDMTYACRLSEVREWVMLWCPRSGLRSTGKDLGTYDRALPGGGSMATEDEVYLGTQGFDGDPKDAVVVSLRPGTKAKPAFTYRPAENPTWLRDESFELELPAGATDLSERRFQGGAWPKTVSRGPIRTQLCDEIDKKEKSHSDAESKQREAAQLEADAKEVDDVAGLSEPPNEAGWDAAKSALVTGSDALGCTTKIAPDWFFMRCGGKVEVRGLEVEKGRRKTQTKATFADGVATLLTPYVEGTDLRLRLDLADGARFLVVRWAPGKKPFEVGRFSEKR